MDVDKLVGTHWVFIASMDSTVFTIESVEEYRDNIVWSWQRNGWSKEYNHHYSLEGFLSLVGRGRARKVSAFEPKYKLFRHGIKDW